MHSMTFLEKCILCIPVIPLCGILYTIIDHEVFEWKLAHPGRPRRHRFDLRQFLGRWVVTYPDRRRTVPLRWRTACYAQAHHGGTMEAEFFWGHFRIKIFER